MSRSCSSHRCPSLARFPQLSAARKSACGTTAAASALLVLLLLLLLLDSWAFETIPN